VLQKDGTDPFRAVSFDRFANPRQLRSKRKPGDQRWKWNEKVIEDAVQALEVMDNRSLNGHPHTRVAVLAQDRQAWRHKITAWLKKSDWSGFD